MQKVKDKGYSVQKLEWKHSDGSNCITSRANAVGNKNIHFILLYAYRTLGKHNVMLHSDCICLFVLSVCPSICAIFRWLDDID